MLLLVLILSTWSLASALHARVAFLPNRHTLTTNSYAQVYNNSSSSTILVAAGAGKMKSVLVAEKLDFYQTMTAGTYIIILSSLSLAFKGEKILN
jgi:hypothetical protein